MLRENRELLIKLHKVLDIFIVVISFIIAYHIKIYFPFKAINGLAVKPNYYLVLLAIVVQAPLFFRLAGCYQSYRNQTFQEIGLRTSKAVGGTLVGTIVVLFALHEYAVSRLLLVLFSCILIGMLLLTKGIVYYTLRHFRSKNYNTRNVLIIGTGNRARRIITSLRHNQKNGYKIIGCLEPFKKGTLISAAPNLPEEVKILGTIDLLPIMLLKDVIDEVIFAADLGDIPSINNYIQLTEELGISIHIVPDFQLEKIMYQPETAKVFMEEFVGLPTIALSTTPQRHGELLSKNFIDYLAAGCGLFLLAPLFLIIIIAIKLTSKGPAFFIQQRSGLYGRTFNLIKFRTMVENAEELKKELHDKNEVDGPVFKMANDPRITSVGKFLRKTSFDELPQLINVLMGEMSLVGPRPPLPAEIAQYEPWQRRRLSVKPGLTCIWQVSGRNNIDFKSWMKMDLEYIDNWSLLLDMKILLKTVKEVAYLNGR